MTKRWGVGLRIAVMVVLALAIGCKRKTTTDTTGTTTTTMSSYTSGQKVDVKWNGKWWKGEILAVGAATYRIHYTGWSASWDEEVTPDRIRPSTTESSVGTELAAGASPTPATPITTKQVAGWKSGDKVDVSWNGTWWQASILSVNGATYRVHYIGWASSWDENVGASRVRAWTGGAKKGSGPN